MPNRMLSGELTTSESLSNVSMEAELTFVHLISIVDDFGRYDGRPVILLAALYPTRAGSISVEALTRWLAELEAEGLIRWYVAGGRRYLEIPTWRKHQRVRAAHSKWPDPEDAPSPNQAPQTTRRELRSRDGDSRSSAAESRESRDERRETKIEHLGNSEVVARAPCAADAAPATAESPPPASLEPPAPPQHARAEGKQKRASGSLELPARGDPLYADLAQAYRFGPLDPAVVHAWAQMVLPKIRAGGYRNARKTLAKWWPRATRAEVQAAAEKRGREIHAAQPRSPPIDISPEDVETLFRKIGARTS